MWSIRDQCFQFNLTMNLLGDYSTKLCLVWHKARSIWCHMIISWQGAHTNLMLSLTEFSLAQGQLCYLMRIELDGLLALIILWQDEHSNLLLSFSKLSSITHTYSSCLLYLVLLSGHLSEYWKGSILLNFGKVVEKVYSVF